MTALSDIPSRAVAADPPQIDTYDARALVQKGVQARIILDGQAYYLRITRAGKLILTK